MTLFNEWSDLLTYLIAIKYPTRIFLDACLSNTAVAKVRILKFLIRKEYKVVFFYTLADMTLRFTGST